MLTGEPEQRLEGSHRRTAPVEAEDKLVQIVRQVFLAHTAMSAPDPRLQMSKDPMDPREQGRRLFRRPLRRGPVVIPTRLEWGVALPAVRPDGAPGDHRRLRKPSQSRR